MSTNYTLIPSFNATVNDVQYPVAYTMIATIITFALMLSPYVFWIKSTHSLLGKNSKYTNKLLKVDLFFMWIIWGVMAAMYISAWGGYTTILASFRPNQLINTAPYGLPEGQDTFFCVVTSILMAFFTSLIIYRTSAVAYGHSDAVCISEPPITDLAAHGYTKDSMTKPALTDNQSLHWEKVDVTNTGCSKFFRIFVTVLLVFSFMLFLTIYPYSVNGKYLTQPTFLVSAQLQLATGIILCTCMFWVLVTGSWNREGYAYDIFISRLFNNTDVVTHSYANALHGFSLTGHILSIEVNTWWILSFLAFWYVDVYEITCSIEKANTIQVAVVLSALVLAHMSQKRGTYLPFFMAGLFFLMTTAYIIEYSNPPETFRVIGQSQINYNYLTVAANCTNGKMAPDAGTIIFMTIAGFVLSIFALLDICMHRRATYSAGELKFQPVTEVADT